MYFCAQFRIMIWYIYTSFMNKIKVLALFLCLFAVSAMAQIRVTGTVLEDSGEGAIGANVIAEGTTVGTVTDFDGNFELTVPAGVKNLEISYTGFKTELVPVKPVVKVQLKVDAQELEEVEVRGIVSVDKRMSTGASTQVDADKAKLDGMADISRSLEGRAAGVTVQNVSGTFGTAPKINVRGVTSIYGASKPLWVVDGVIMEDAVEMDANDLSSGDAKTLIASAIAGINSDDIESFQILKDGSATSIYGARAMAGVIIVTTKKGKAGHTSLNYTGEFTYRLKPSYNDYNICNSQEQMAIYQELERKGWLEYTTLSRAKNSGVYGRMYQLINSAEQGGYGIENTITARNAYLREAEFRNTDWFDELFNHTIMHNHSLSFSTGTERGQIYASLSALHDPGWYKDSQVARFTGTLKANYDITKKLSISAGTKASYRKQKAPGTINASTDPITGAVSREFDINPFSYAMNTSRVMGAHDTQRRNYCDFNIFDELEQNYIDINVTDITFQGELNYKPIKGLEFHALAALHYFKSVREHNIMDNSNQARAYRAGVDPEDQTIRENNSFLYTDPDDNTALPISVMPVGGIYDLNEDYMLSTNFRGTVQYKTFFGRDDSHNIQVFAGAESNSVNRQSVWFRGWGYQYENGGVPYSDYNLFKQSQEENTPYFSNDFGYDRILAFYGMGTYSYKARYTVNGTIRYEGTNRLGKSTSSRWLPTWNISASWNAHEESWWTGEFANAWSNASLRASYSLTADRGPYWVTNSLPVFVSYSPYRPLTNVAESGIELDEIENSELTYEKKHELNIGVSLGFIKNRINFDFDIWWRNNYDLIGQVQTQGIGGSVTKWANDATMNSHGLEFTLSTVNIKTKDWKWSSDLIFSYATDKITKLDAMSPVYSLVAGSMWSRREGYPVHSLFSVPFAGLTEEGLPTFYTNKEHTQTTITDINFQEYNDVDYLTFEGTMDPKFNGSFNNTIKWKDLTLTIFLTYSFGSVLRLNPLCYTYSSDYSDLTASQREMKNRWVVPGDENVTTIPVIATSRQFSEISNLNWAYSAYNYSDQRVAKGDFIRLKEISLNYDLPKKVFEGQNAVKSFSVKLSATNICLLYADKKLNGQDPEYFSTGGVSSPVPRQFTLTVRLGM